MTGIPPGPNCTFIGDEDVEYISLGGYHLVHLGDTFPTQENLSRWVALKIIIADLTGNNRDTTVLKWRNTRFHDHPGLRSQTTYLQQETVVPGGRRTAVVPLYPPQFLIAPMIQICTLGTPVSKYLVSTNTRRDQMMELMEEPSILPVIP
ncbi:uncharacterized protein EDB91DRAFT_1085542 [Suillus paluster]|uniref:uncharacterized protein n=1 Tax=Suillus paluster TaxID=48578 RepID=UPI001B85C7CF|nr:uncharacterized protein EDB91DRAFT_1085542 [Suillus paluster]KAG1730116.1 hypothetical protein EDB91DRAFT_1085542 [Suillus paluster]